jgi:hypothetical protein
VFDLSAVPMRSSIRQRRRPRTTSEQAAVGLQTDTASADYIHRLPAGVVVSICSFRLTNWIPRA